MNYWKMWNKLEKESKEWKKGSDRRLLWDFLLLISEILIQQLETSSNLETLLVKKMAKPKRKLSPEQLRKMQEGLRNYWMVKGEIK